MWVSGRGVPGFFDKEGGKIATRDMRHKEAGSQGFAVSLPSSLSSLHFNIEPLARLVAGRVLARKPKGWHTMKPDINQFRAAFSANFDPNTLVNPRKNCAVLKGENAMIDIRANITRFSDDDSGNVTIFSVFMVVLILTITGASVDIMRFEAVRAKMQSTMDRAVLAAADLDQEQDPQAVVIDYMTKAGIEDVLGSVTVDQGLNYRTVTAQGTTDLNTIFLHMSGMDTLTAPALSSAEEKISNVEISVVLDVSGSMGGSRIENMRAAAAEFIDTVIQDTGEGSGLTTVSLVPYNATVNLGDTVSEYFTLTSLFGSDPNGNQNNGWGNGDQDAPGGSLCHNNAENYDEGQASASCTSDTATPPPAAYSSCVSFEASDFKSVSISPDQMLTRLGHFDRYSTNTSSTSIGSPWCKTGNTSAIMVHSADRTALKAHINSLNAGGNTAIDLGMKWGVALLDSATRPAVAQMATDGHVPTEASSRPAAYDDPEAIKFVVVMTDGENTTQYDLKSKYKYGWSSIWVDDRGTSSKSDDRYSVRVVDNKGDTNDLYYWVRYDGYSHSYKYRSQPDGGSNAVPMYNAELFSRFGTRAAAQKFFVTPYYDGYVSYDEYYDLYYASQATVDGNMADDRLDDICSAAKEEGIVVFTIGFEAPTRGQQAMKSCASSEAHYFDVDGVEITETFHAIARQINSLRLIQ